MKLELIFQGRVRNRQKLVQVVQKLAKREQYRVGIWETGMRVVFCPMGYLDFAWQKQGGLFGVWNITGGADTSVGGAGLHCAVVSFLDELGKQVELQVEDHTHYIQHHSWETLYETAFLPWLISWTREMIDTLTLHPEGTVALWEQGQYLPTLVERTVATPMGRFSKEELVLGLAQPQVWAERFFLWCHQERDALFYRNCALKRLWEDCYYVPSARSQEDAQFNGESIQWLERAAELDRNIPIPYECYEELCTLDAKHMKIPPNCPRMPGSYEIGYRRGEIKQPCYDILLPLPGSYQYEPTPEAPEDVGIWWDAYQGSPIWRIRVYQVQEGSNPPFTEQQESFIAIENGQLQYQQEVLQDHKHPEHTLYRVKCQLFIEKTLYVIVITYSELSEWEDIANRLSRIEGKKGSGIL